MLQNGAIGARRRGESGYRGAHNIEDCTVLCAQPDEALREIVVRALEGCRLVTAKSGLEAIHAMDAVHFNLYVLAHDLPEWSGLGLCRHIRKRDRYGPICFFTHTNAEGFRASALACGADMVIVPTLDARALRSQLAESLKFRLTRLTTCTTSRDGSGTVIRIVPERRATSS